MRELTKTQLKDMTPNEGVMEAYAIGNTKPYEEYFEKAKPISDRYAINLNWAANKLDQSNNWLVWSTILLAVTEIIVSIIQE